MRPRHIVMATGVSGIPSLPDIPSLHNFRGKVLHSSQYYDGEAWRGKDAIVIGTGNSGHDIAQDLHSSGANVTIVQRSPTLIVNIEPSAQLPYALYDEGPPLEDCDLITTSMPVALMRKSHVRFTEQAKSLDRELLDRLEGVGFKLDFGEDGTGWQFKYLTRGGGYYFNAASQAAGRARELAQEAGTRISEATARTGSAVSDMAGRTADATARASSAVSDMAGHTAEVTARTGSAVSDMAGRTAVGISRAAGDAATTASDLGRQAQSRFSDLVEKHPLVLGGLGLALGAALAYSLRPTEAEARLVGDASARLRRRAREMR